MASVTKGYRQSMPATRFIGIGYTDDQKRDGTFSHLWGEWFEAGRFAALEPLAAGLKGYEDRNAYCGLFECKKGQPNRYWLGMFTPAGTPVPEGYQSLDLGAAEMAVLWVCGKEPDIYFFDSMERLKAEGYAWKEDADGALWCVERYACPRFTEPDAQGNVTLDMCFPVE